MVSKPWMQTMESNGKTDYKYYTIEYTSHCLTNLCTVNCEPENYNWISYIISIDKSKFLTGVGLDWRGVEYIDLNIISAGF